MIWGAGTISLVLNINSIMNKFWSILGIGMIMLSACHSGKTLKDDEIDPALPKQLR